MEREEFSARLRDLAFTKGLDGELLDRLAELTTPIHCEADAIIFREGEIGTSLYVVEEGRVAIELTLPGRGRVTILTVGRGQIFGWSSVFYDGPKSNSARAVVATKALALDAVRLRALCDTDTRFGYILARRLLEAVSERLKATRIQLLDLFAHPSNSHPAHHGGKP